MRSGSSITNLVASMLVCLRRKSIDTLWMLVYLSNLFVPVFNELGLYCLVSGKLCINSGFAEVD